MRRKDNQWIRIAIGVASLLSANLLFSWNGVPPFHSLAAGAMFAFTLFGIDRLYAALVDIVLILVKPSAPEGKTAA